MKMKYQNNEYQIDFTELNGNEIAILNGKGYLIKGTTNTLKFLSEKQLNSFFINDEKHSYIWIEGHQYTFDLPKNKDEYDYGNSHESIGNSNVKSPMPGNVIKILVEENQEVKNGDSLIIIEAMKMESTIYSSLDGIIKKINVKAGQQIDSDMILIEIE